MKLLKTSTYRWVAQYFNRVHFFIVFAKWITPGPAGAVQCRRAFAYFNVIHHVIQLLRLQRNSSSQQQDNYHTTPKTCHRKTKRLPPSLQHQNNPTIQQQTSIQHSYHTRRNTSTTIQPQPTNGTYQRNYKPYNRHRPQQSSTYKNLPPFHGSLPSQCHHQEDTKNILYHTSTTPTTSNNDMQDQQHTNHQATHHRSQKRAISKLPKRSTQYQPSLLRNQ